MNVFKLRVFPVDGDGQLVRVAMFAGPDVGHLQRAGELRLSVGEYQLLGAAMSIGAQKAIGHMQLIVEDFRNTTPAVHILYNGFPLCCFDDRVPGEWPEGHTWVGLLEREKATCPICTGRAPFYVDLAEEGA